MENVINKNSNGKNGSGIANNNLLLFIVCVGGIVVAGFFVGMLSNATGGYVGYTQPSFTPPSIVFAIVWPILYAMMGISLYLAIKSHNSALQNANRAIENQGNGKKKTNIDVFGAFLIAFFVQLTLNFLWPFLFFTFKNFTASAIVCALLIGSIVTTVILAFKINKASAILLIPYLLWIVFATVLNVSVAIIN